MPKFCCGQEESIKINMYVPVTEEERKILAIVVKERVIIDKTKLDDSRNKWKNSLDGKFLGLKISIQILKDSVNGKWLIANKA